MKRGLAEIILPQLDELIARFEALHQRHKASGYYDWSAIHEDEANEFVTAGMAAIHRASGANSQFALQTEEVIKKYSPRRYAVVPYVGGALKALRQAVTSGYLDSVQELIHASIFADFLEMAEHLLGEGYKDPAAVLIGGVLEGHLRKLCDKNSLLTAFKNSRGTDRPKNAETMNTDLAGAGVYSKLDQKNITAWLDLRNKAAHGQYSEYTAQQVELLLQAVRDFLTRHPA